MKRIVLVMLCFLSACTVTTKPDPETQLVINQHTAILNAISLYISDLQAKNVLPKPENKDGEKEN